MNYLKCNMKHHYQLGELFDKLSIYNLKEINVPETREQVTQDIQDILHDINIILTNHPKSQQITAEYLRDLMLLAQFNTLIWENEKNARAGDENNNLLVFTHSLNGIRCEARNRLQKMVDGRIEKKVNCLAGEVKEHWRPSGY